MREAGSEEFKSENALAVKKAVAVSCRVRDTYIHTSRKPLQPCTVTLIIRWDFGARILLPEQNIDTCIEVYTRQKTKHDKHVDSKNTDQTDTKEIDRRREAEETFGVECTRTQTGAAVSNHIR